MKHEFHHITEEERKEAQRLWNEFNTELDRRGMKLHYDYENGNFFVADKSLANGDFDRGGEPATERTLNSDELKQVIYEGGFDHEAVNNPPWFVSTGQCGYSLKVPPETAK